MIQKKMQSAIRQSEAKLNTRLTDIRRSYNEMLAAGGKEKLPLATKANMKKVEHMIDEAEDIKGLDFDFQLTWAPPQGFAGSPCAR